MSTSVLINPPKPKCDISHLVGRPLVPFFEDGESSKYDNFSVPAEYQIAARKFVNGYWVNEDGSRAEIGENTPTLIKKNDSLDNSSNKKQQNKNQSKPSKNNNNNNNSNANKENINHKSNKSTSQLLSPTTNGQQTKAEKKKSKAANNSSPTPSSPSYAAIVARTSSAPPSSTTNETFQTPSRSKSTANPSNNAAISTSKDNYAALASPAPVNIPMPKFLGSSPAPTNASTTPSSTDAQSCEEMSAHLMSLLKKTTIPSNPSNPSVSVSSVASGASVPSGAAMPYPYPYPHHPYPYPYSASGHAVYSAPAIPQQPPQNSSSAPSQSSTSVGASLMLLTGNQSGESSVRTVPVNPPAAFAAPYPYPNYSYHHYPPAAYPSYGHPGYAPLGYGAYHHPHYMPLPPPAAAVTH